MGEGADWAEEGVRYHGPARGGPRIRMAQQLRLNVTPEKAGSLLASLLARRGARIVSRDGGTITFGVGDDASGTASVTPNADGGVAVQIEARSLALLAVANWVEREMRRGFRSSASTAGGDVSGGFAGLRAKLGLPEPPPPPPAPVQPEGAEGEVPGAGFLGPRPGGPRFGPRPGGPTFGGPRQIGRAHV